MCAQGRIAEAARRGVHVPFLRAESELLETLRLFLIGRGVSAPAASAEVSALADAGQLDYRHEEALRLSEPVTGCDVASSSGGPVEGLCFGGGVSAAVAPGASVRAGGSPPAEACEGGGPSEPSPSAAGDASDSDGVPCPVLPVGSLVVAVTLRSKRRTLHRIPGCGRRPGASYLDYVVLDGPPTPADYSQVCRGCWPSSAPPCASRVGRRSASAGSSSTSRSSESSSSSDSAAA